MTGPGNEAEPDAYKVLQVDPEADPEVIQAAHRRLVQKYHPDRGSGLENPARIVAINAAWEILGNATRRAAYDTRRASGPRGGPVNHPASGPAGAPTSAGGETRPRDPAAGQGAGPHAGPHARSGGGSAQHPSQQPSPETVARDWTSGRSSIGGGYDESRMRTADGEGAAGPPPGRPSGSVLNFGRYAGWSLGEIARTDLGYLEWLDRMTIGRNYREELDGILRTAGRRRGAPLEDDRRGLFRRR